MSGFLVRNDIRYLKKLELTSNKAVKQVVIAGMGYSIMPLIGIKNELFNKYLKLYLQRDCQLIHVEPYLEERQKSIRHYRQRIWSISRLISNIL